MVALIFGWLIFIALLMWLGEDGMNAFWIIALVTINLANLVLFFT